MHPGQNRLLALALVALSTAGVTVAAQSTRSQEIDVLNALLLEVRDLRAVVEQTASAGPRVQLALGRLQLQEQRVNTAIRRLESHRGAMAAAEKGAAAAQAQLATMQKIFQNGVAPPEGNPLADMMAGLESAVTAGAADLQRLQSDEALLQQEVAREQTRWLEVNRTLEELERTLSRR